MTSSRFWIGCGLVAFAGGLAFAIAWQQLASREELAARRNAFIEQEIEKLKLQVAEIRDLREAATLYDAMARAANRVQQQNTVYAAEAVAELSRLPRPIVLTGVTVDKSRISLTGEASSESALAQLQPAFEQSGFVTRVRIEKAAPAGGKHGFRAEADLATSPASSAASVGKQQ